MDQAVYVRMANDEDSHWWFAGRREIIKCLIERACDLPDQPRILEAGCGTGGNLELLKHYGKVDAFELDEGARQIAEAKSGLPIMPGSLPDDVEIQSGSYDLIALFDVLEHVEYDCDSLKTLGQGLRENGKMLITVPAMQWLWSAHDEHHHHFRRYSKGSLTATVRRAGLEIETAGYFNTLLFPAAVAERFAKKLMGSTNASDEKPNRFLNSIFGTVFGFERHLAGRIPMPVGLSAFAVVRRPTP